MSLVFVDCEAYGPCPSMGRLTWYGAVDYNTFLTGHPATFSGVVVPSRARRDNPAIPEEIDPVSEDQYFLKLLDSFTQFDLWLSGLGRTSHIFITDNPAFDWQWINDGFWRTMHKNPFGFSARRIGDYYAGLVGDFKKASEWKRLRVTKHDHNPVNDAMGNAEAFRRMTAGERPPLRSNMTNDWKRKV